MLAAGRPKSVRPMGCGAAPAGRGGTAACNCVVPPNVREGDVPGRTGGMAPGRMPGISDGRMPPAGAPAGAVGRAAGAVVVEEVEEVEEGEETAGIDVAVARVAVGAVS